MCGGNKGTTTSQTSQTAAPNPQAASLYSSILGQAQGVAATPYQPYTGEQVAPVNAQQTTGINAINAEQPVFGEATNMMQQASQPITAAQISQYESPYTQQVVNATQAEFNNQNAQQQQGVLGNAVAQGALGGNRTGIAQAELANQQSLAQAPVIANLENQGYTTGLNTALTEQQAQQQGALGLDSTANSALSGANAQIGAGTLQQQTQQAQDTAQYQNYLNAMGYPFQTTQWLAGIGTGVGSQMGGTTAGTGSTTVPPPSIASDLLGAGTAALGVAKLAALSTGGAVNRAAGGGVADGPDYPTIPEASHTLHAQQKQLVSGDRHVQMFPHGTKELPLPHGMKRVQSHSGTFHYNPQHVTASDIHNHSKSGHEHALLGLGPFSKHEIMHRLARGEHALAIVERNEHGHEVRAALGTHNTAHVQAHHMNRGKSKGHTVHIEFPHKVLGDRMAAHRQTGGSVTGSGGVAGLPPVPYTGGTSYIPGANITPGQGAPATSGQPPKPPSDPSLGNNTNSLANIFAGLNKKDSSGDTTGGVPLTSGISSVPADSGYVQTNSDDNYDANSSYDYSPDTDAAEENAEAGNSKRGGRIRGYDSGGGTIMDPDMQVGSDPDQTVVPTDPNAGVAAAPPPDDVVTAHQREAAVRRGLAAGSPDQAAWGSDIPISPSPETTTVPSANVLNSNDVPLPRPRPALADALDPNSVPLPRPRPALADASNSVPLPRPRPAAADVGVASSVSPEVTTVPKPVTPGSTPAGVTAGSTPPVATSSLTTAPSTQPTRDTSNDLFGVPAEDVAKASVATKHLESGGKYQNFKTTTNSQGQPQTALGAYGVMDFNLPQWSQEALGYKVSPQEFLKNSDIQDQIYKYKMSQYISKYGMEGAGRAWLGGEGALMAPNRKDPLGTTVGGYGSQFAQMADPEGKYSAKAFSHANPPGAATSDNQGVATPSNTQGVATPPNDSGNQKPGFLDKIFAKDPDLGMALISAGGAMMSSRSPYLAQGLGAGMQTGVGTYYGMKQQEQQQAINQQKVNLEAAKLGAETDLNRKKYELSLSKPAVIGERQTFAGPQRVYGDPITHQPISVDQTSDGSAPNFDPTKLPEGVDKNTGIDPKTGYDEGYLQTLPAQEKSLLKGLANYTIDPNKVGYRNKTQLQADVSTYTGGQFRDDIYPNIMQTEQAFNKGKQGDQVRFFNNSIQHMTTLQKYADAMGNTSTPAYNYLRNVIETQLGYPAPNTFEGLKDIVGQEIVKSVVANGGGEAERQALAAKLASKNSAPQLQQMLEGYKELGGAQLRDLKVQYENGTYHKRNDFADKLIPESKEYLDKVEAAAAARNNPNAAAAPATPAATTAQPPTAQPGEFKQQGNWVYRRQPDGTYKQDHKVTEVAS